MAAAVKTEKELGEAIKRQDDEIIIEGDLKNKVIRIRAAGKVAWAIAIGAISGAVLVSLLSGGTAAPAGITVGLAAVGVLGAPATAAAFAIAVAAGGVDALDKLRSYKTVSDTGNRLVLKRK
ncbi:hypothetical protein IJT17_08535 [bacterium]|nr:hypothetical protein [bacterium]